MTMLTARARVALISLVALGLAAGAAWEMAAGGSEPNAAGGIDEPSEPPSSRTSFGAQSRAGGTAEDGEPSAATEPTEEAYDPAADVGPNPNALLETAEMIAAQEGISVEDVLTTLKFQALGGDYVSLVVAAYPDLYAGGAYDSGFTNRELTIYFKGPVPDDIAARLPPIPKEVRFEGGRIFSYEEMRERTAAIFYGLIELRCPSASSRGRGRHGDRDRCHSRSDR